MDAAISPGSSGGPVVNNHGEVIGISVSSFVSGQNLNFAIPIRYLRELRLDWHVGIREAGGLAVSDLEEAGFHGPVKTFIERKSQYELDPITQQPVYVRDVPVSASRFSPEGQVMESTAFSGKGVPLSQLSYEYSADGLVKRITNRATNPADSFSYEYPSEAAVYIHMVGKYFDGTHPSGKQGEQNYHEDTYDSEGHVTQQIYPAEGIRYVPKYDSLGRQIENRGYKNGRLWCIFQYSYDTNGHGDWEKQQERLWCEGTPENDFGLNSESSREIAYYDDQQ